MVFLDESGFMLTPIIRRTYAPRGETPINRCWDRRDRISAISAITVSPRRQRRGLYFHLLPDNENVHGEDTVRFLRELKSHIRGNATIVWDRGQVHDRSRAVRDYLAKHPEILTERFPSYAPELNPDEQVWTNTKYGRLPNFAPADLSELRRRLQAELRKLRRRSDLLASFIHCTRLPFPI